MPVRPFVPILHLTRPLIYHFGLIRSPLITPIHRVSAITTYIRSVNTMSASEPMAVEAPTLSHPEDVASHAPHVNVAQYRNGKPISATNGARKRGDSSSSEDEKPLVSLASPVSPHRGGRPPPRTYFPIEMCVSRLIFRPKESDLPARTGRREMAMPGLTGRRCMSNLSRSPR
jgi:hypothetical protein